MPVACLAQCSLPVPSSKFQVSNAPASPHWSGTTRYASSSVCLCPSSPTSSWPPAASRRRPLSTIVLRIPPARAPSHSAANTQSDTDVLLMPERLPQPPWRPMSCRCSELPETVTYPRPRDMRIGTECFTVPVQQWGCSAPGCIAKHQFDMPLGPID